MRYGVFVALGLALGLACSLADELEGAACRGEADCEKSQTCVKTLHQLSTGVGQCSSDGSCVVGEQVGCACDGQACTNFELTPVPHAKQKDSTGAPLCFCCQSATECGEGLEPVIAEFQGNSARCTCCPICEDPEMQVRDEDDDGNIVECGCLEPMTTETDTDTSGS